MNVHEAIMTDEEFGTFEKRKAAMEQYQQQFIDLAKSKPELAGMISFNWQKMSRASVARIHEIGAFVLNPHNKIAIGGGIVIAGMRITESETVI